MMWSSKLLQKPQDLDYQLVKDLVSLYMKLLNMPQKASAFTKISNSTILDTTMNDTISNMLINHGRG